MSNPSHSDFRLLAPLEIPVDFRMRSGEDPKECFLLLHGYSQTGRTIYRQLIDSLPASARVIAPNGTFPIPKRIPNGYEIRCSWYFYNPQTDDYFIDMKPAVTALKQVIAEHGTSAGVDLPLTIIGFSQGGYLAPFVGRALSQTKRVIGIGAQFLDEELRDPPPFEMIALHGKLDEIIDGTTAERSVKVLQTRGVRAQFEWFENLGHEIGPEISARLREITET